MKEKYLQEQVCNYLRMKGHYFYSIPNGFWNGITNKVKKFAYINSLKRQGLLVGVADIEIKMDDGTTVYFELKVEKNKQSEHQKLFQENVEIRNNAYYIIRSLDDVIKLGF